LQGNVLDVFSRRLQAGGAKSAFAGIKALVSLELFPVAPGRPQFRYSLSIRSTPAFLKHHVGPQTYQKKRPSGNGAGTR
jgi:hypothetical protein